MRVELDIKDSKAEYILGLLKQYSYVKVKTLADKKAAKVQFLKEFEEAIEEVKLSIEGKIQLKSADAFLNEL